MEVGREAAETRLQLVALSTGEVYDSFVLPERRLDLLFAFGDHLAVSMASFTAHPDSQYDRLVLWKDDDLFEDVEITNEDLNDKIALKPGANGNHLYRVSPEIGEFFVLPTEDTWVVMVFFPGNLASKLGTMLDGRV